MYIIECLFVILYNKYPLIYFGHVADHGFLRRVAHIPYY